MEHRQESNSVPQLKDYHVSEITGFLLENPLVDLPEYFQPWSVIAKNSTHLLEAHRMREEIDKMPLLDVNKLNGHREKRLASLMMCVMTAGYVWQEGDEGMAKVVPRQLAIPMCRIAEELRLPVIGTHTAYCLANWQLKDTDGPFDLSNLSTICVVAKGDQCDWFFAVTAQVEYYAVPGLKAVVSAQEGVVEEDVNKVIAALTVLSQTIHTMRETVARMFEYLKVDGFYHGFRPYLSGWGGPGSPAPDGIIFEGYSDKPIKSAGGSAAQSASPQCFDALLGIVHEEKRQQFLDSMKEYMLPSHGDYIDAIRRGPSLIKFVNLIDVPALTEVYNDCVKAMEKFRTYHIQVCTRYIVIPASKKNRELKHEALSKVGTGGTDLIPFLRSIRDTTKGSVIQD